MKSVELYLRGKDVVGYVALKMVKPRVYSGAEFCVGEKWLDHCS